MRSEGAKILKFSLVCLSGEWRKENEWHWATRVAHFGLLCCSARILLLYLLLLTRSPPCEVEGKLKKSFEDRLCRHWNLKKKKKNKEKLLELKLGKKGRKYWKIFSWFCFYLKQNKIFDRWMAKKKRKMTGTELWYDNNHHHITMRIMAQRPKADRSKDFLLYYHPIRCSILYTTVYFSFWILIAIYLYCSPLLCVAFISRLLLVSTY